MNRYPVWKYGVIVVAVLFGLLYSSPTLLAKFFGSAPIVQVSEPNTEQLDPKLVQHVRNILDNANIEPELIETSEHNITIRLDSQDTQKRTREALERVLHANAADNKYIVAVNTQALTPSWLKSIGAKPVSLGLDLRGGVHFLLQVDMQEALSNRLDSMVSSTRASLRDHKIRYSSVKRNGDAIEVILPDQKAFEGALADIRSPEVQIVEDVTDNKFRLYVSLSELAAKNIQELALQQNIVTLHNRINALGVAEPIIQQQGLDRIVVQLPGLHDTTEAKAILGRTATLQIRMVDERPQALAALSGQGPVPLGSERFLDRSGNPIILYREVELTGENLIDAQPSRDDRTGQPAVALSLDSKGAKKFYDITLRNRDKRMAIVLFEQGVGVVVTAPNINEPIAGGRVQISGAMNAKESQNIALLLRSGSLAAPMEIIEERTIGPSLGDENIERGVKSVVYGFAVVAVFMCLYYLLFGVFSTISMFVNLLLLVSVMSLMQATLTLPGIAAMALALGIAIDSNVLINERIREELRAGASPHMAILAGYENAWRTILDSNITSLIAGIALLTCDAGPIRGFAVVHCLGILTSLFSSVFISRGLVNLWYGRNRKLKSLAIGQIWKPTQD